MKILFLNGSTLFHRIAFNCWFHKTSLTNSSVFSSLLLSYLHAVLLSLYAYIYKQCIFHCIFFFFLQVNCSILQKTGASYHSALSCFWDVTNDNLLTIQWPNEKHRDPNAKCSCHLVISGFML